MLWKRLKNLWRLSSIEVPEYTRRKENPLLNIFQKKRGAIYEPPSEVDEQRQAIIDENKAQGKDTRLSDLIPSDENNS